MFLANRLVARKTMFSTGVQVACSKRWLNQLRLLQKTAVLILDDLGLEPLTNQQCNDLLEIVEDRYEQSSTIVISQFPVDKWYGLMENPKSPVATLNGAGDFGFVTLWIPSTHSLEKAWAG